MSVYHPTIPKKYDAYERYVIIDYDNDEKLYKNRIETYENLAKPIKMILPKGEDINSLYNSASKKHLLFNLIR